MLWTTNKFDTHDSYFIAVQGSGPAVDTVQLRIDSVEEQLMMDPVSYDEVGLILLVLRLSP